jgi:hypothetical protein
MIQIITTPEMPDSKRAFPMVRFNACVMQLSLCGLERKTTLKHLRWNIE